MTLPDGSTATLHDIGSHTFLDGARNTVQNGCVGNGTTDDRAALNTLANTTLLTGGAIYFAAPYVYRISSDLTLPANVMLIIPPGASLSIDTGVVVTILGTVYAATSAWVAGLGSILWGSGATRPRKSARLASSVSTGAYTYLPKPGDASLSITLPLFATIVSMRLVGLDTHPANGLTTVYAVTNQGGGTTYLTVSITDGQVPFTADADTETTAPVVTGNDATVILSASGTDITRYRGWLEILYDG